MNEHEEITLAALAGLLHDVGKFAQRAQKEAGDAEGASQGLPLPDFLRDVLPSGDAVESLAANADPGNRMAWLVKAANTLAAGERATLPARGASSASPSRQLLSIFSVIDADGTCWKNDQSHWKYLPLRKLALDEGSIFPGAALAASEIQDATKELWNAFKTGAEDLKSLTDPGEYLEAMLALLQRYGWCVPSAYGHARADVSLYDHSRMTAALAACLADAKEFPAELLAQIANAPEQSQEEVALLIGGDISGVQDFIYTISSKGAAKMLRGRSFYLQLLTEAVLRFILRRLGLPYTNVIYSGGGHFYLLAPRHVSNELRKIQAEVSNILLKQHGTQLYLALGWAPVPASGFGAGRLRDYWQKMHNQLAHAKNRRYSELDADFHKRVFALPAYGGNPGDTCPVCGDDRRKTTKWDYLETQERICSLCLSFADTIGKQLPDSRFLVLEFSEPPADAEIVAEATDILESLGMKVRFLPGVAGNIDLQSAQAAIIWALDDPPSNAKNEERWPQTSRAIPQWLRYTVNRVPKFTFDELQKQTEGGFERLGVLRMDVDNLGSIFRDGLGDTFSLSRMATLSFQMSLFFEGWLKRIVEDVAWHDLVYTVYSGGDDLFLLAPWDKVPALAQKIVDDFSQFAAQHPGLHISGGMAFIDGKYPIYQAAEDAADAEDLAKKGEKNAFGFLNKRWQWIAFRELANRKNELRTLLESEGEGESGGPKSSLQTLRALAQMEEEATNEGRPTWGRWMWMGAYHLTRMEQRYEKKPEMKKKIARLRENLGNFQHLETWGAAARWAQLEVRKKKNA